MSGWSHGRQIAYLTYKLAAFGIDYLAGVQVTDPGQLRRTVAEGGGTRLFEGGVQYRLASLTDVSSPT